eukprot:TRINITY_DN20338_c0_g1_i1.p1 TRINITY_DN20338_c0_g1~~TRINITY_DN20338_c0_g1_i1.p1  ORF type:complete len:149 (-),score=34.56 TRINITY_DN20338_c0_g1_i1:73-519(-)
MMNITGSDQRPSQSTYQIPTLDITNIRIFAQFKLEPSATVGIPFPLAIVINNKTHLAQDIDLKVIENDYFILAGEKKSYFTINATSTYIINYTFLPLICGRVMLPRFDIMAPRLGIQLVKPSTERFVFVKPLVSDKLLIFTGSGTGMM